MPAACGFLVAVPEPHIHDEFSYLLGADTFAHGRLTNPAPSLPEFFESPHVLVEPSYNSKYPPGQAMMLAFGQLLTGRPIWGVWISCGLFAATLCWMLQAWTPRQYALAVAVLAITTLGTSTYWAQSYFGAMLPASGGALLFGGMRRTLRAPRASTSVLMAIGVLLLACTRPYEGLLVCAAAAIPLARWLLTDTRIPFPARLTSCLLPFSAVLIAGGACLAVHNRAVTGHWATTPYGIHQRQYFHQGIFLFSPIRPPERRPVERVASFYRLYKSPPTRGWQLAGQTAQLLVVRLIRTGAAIFGVFGSPRGNREPYHGVLLWLVLLLAVVRHVSGKMLAVVLLCVALGEAVLWWRFAQYPAFLAPLMISVWLVAFSKSFRGDDWGRFITVTILLVAFGQALIWWWWPHYAAPVIPLALAGVAACVHRLRARVVPGHSSPAIGRTVAAVVVTFVLTSGVLYGLTGVRNIATGGINLQPRTDVKRGLELQGGRHLVFVHYADTFSVHREWVYNPASLNDAPVLFVHDLGPEKNAELMARYPDRLPWNVKVSQGRTQLEPYRVPAVH